MTACFYFTSVIIQKLIDLENKLNNAYSQNASHTEERITFLLCLTLKEGNVYCNGIQN